MARNKRFRGVTRNSGEEGFLEDLKSRGVDVKYESLKLKWVEEHIYTPDFQLSNGIIVEYKGYFDAQDRRKHLHIKQQYPDLDIRFVFQKDQPLRRGAKSRYSDWCEKNNIKYAFGFLPKEWE